jgi:hypothetical protein
MINERGNNYGLYDEIHGPSGTFLYFDANSYERILNELRDWLSGAIQNTTKQVKIRV